MKKSQEFVKLHIGNDSIICTLEHPFFVNNTWVAAKDLRTGDSLFAYSGAKLRIDSLSKFKTDTATTVYNLEVAGNNDFYVSESKVLVHNCETIEMHHLLPVEFEAYFENAGLKIENLKSH